MPEPAIKLTAVIILGFGLGGLFDGILLHQVLEWHHLLSLVEPVEGPLSLRDQIIADGLFHVLMYGVIAYGLWRLWRERTRLTMAPGARVAAALLLGFAAWNVVDVVGFHWLAGIHRIRVNVPDPLAYDLGWLALFAGVPLLIAWRLQRGGDDTGGRRTAVLSALLALGATAWSLAPAPEQPTTIVVFAPNVDGGAAARGLYAAGALPLRSSADGGVWAAVLPADVDRAALRRAGALIIGGGWGAAGCAAWARA